MGRARRQIPWLDTRDGVYYVKWYDAGQTQRLSLGTQDAVEAQARYAQFLAGGSDTFKAKPGKLTVKGALDDYLREHVAEKVVAVRRAREAARHLTAFFGGRPLAEVDIPASRGYADARRGGKIGGGLYRSDARGSESTIRRELVVLQAAANHARKWRRIAPGDMPSIEMPAETPAKAATWLTWEELNRAIDTAPEALGAFIKVAYYTGARRGSIEGLRLSQIDLRAGRINLTSETETDAQRRSKKRRPVVPIDPKMRPTLERLIIEAQARGSQYLFSRRDIYRPFREHMRALGLHDKAHPHVLRHSRATHLLQAGVPIYDVARLLGDTTQTVERVYGHHSADHLAATIAQAR